MYLIAFVFAGNSASNKKFRASMETVNIFELATSMLVTDDQNEICWRQI